jgi:signal transduction histidine kinase
VRWYATFNISLMMWLALQGVALMQGRQAFDMPAFEIVVHAMPALFLGATITQIDLPPRRAWLPWLPVAAGALLLLVPGVHDAPISRLWQVVGWSLGALVYIGRALRGRSHRSATRRVTRGAKTLELVLSGLVPVGVIGAILLQGAFVLYVLPLMTVFVQVLIFTGVVYHRFYDIDVRAARTHELAAAAAEQDRLALLGELSATIAHEIRNPLTGIRSLAQQLSGPVIEDERRLRYTEVILDETARLDRIVGNLTDLARRSAANGVRRHEPTALGPLFEDLVLLVEPRAHRAHVTIRAPATDIIVHASREALAQALLNLLLNAIAHAPQHSVVELDARADRTLVVIRVRDRGPGVPPDRRESIFEPFHTRGGTGLGLTVVRRLAEEHGWRIAVTDAEGGGAAFSITTRAGQAST